MAFYTGGSFSYIPTSVVCHLSPIAERSARIGESIQRVSSIECDATCNLFARVPQLFGLILLLGPAKRTTCCCSPRQTLLPLGPHPNIPSILLSRLPTSSHTTLLPPPSSLLPPRHDIQKIQPPKWPRNQPSPRSRALGGRMPPPRASRPGPGLGGRDNLPAGSPPFVTKIRAILPSSQSPPPLTQIRATLPSSQATIARLSTTTPMVTATRGSMWVPGSISSRSCRQMRRWTRAWAEWARRRNPRCFARLSAGWSHQRSRRSRGNSGDSWTVVCGWRSTIFRRPTPRSLRNPR